MNAIAIRGAGAVTPLGATLRETVDGLCASAVCAKEAGRTRAGTPILVASAPPAPPVALRTPKLEKYLSEPVRALLAAARGALDGAAVEAAPERIGIYVGMGHTSLDCDEFLPALSAAWRDEPGEFGAVGGAPLRLIDPYFSLRTLANGAAAFLAMEHGARGPSVVIAQSATAAAWALQAALDDLSDSRCDVAIVAAADRLTDPTTIVARERAGLLDGEDAPVLGEGAAAVVLGRGEGRAGAASLIACEILQLQEDVEREVRTAIEALLQTSGIQPRDVRARVTRADSADVCLLSGAVRSAGITNVEEGQPTGDLGAATPLVWTALAARRVAAAGGYELIVSRDNTEGVGLVLVGRAL